MQGHLLIAHPLLHDGFFSRAVVYISNHNSEGAVGFCLNFRTQFMLRDVRPEIKNGNFPIYDGGPVAKDQLFFLHTLGHELSDSVHIGNNLYAGGDFAELLRMIEHGKVKSYDVRFFVGYSGWSEGQLEEEIKNRHWLINSPSDRDFFMQDANVLWGQQLAMIKNSYSIFADFGFDPSPN